MGQRRLPQKTQNPKQRGGADAFYDRGNAQQRARQFAEAVASYDLALAIKPDWVEALTNRGVALRNLKRPEDAVASYDRVLALRPTFALALANRGNALCDLGRHHQALASYDQALVIQPAYPDVLNNRGNVLRALGRHAEALESYDRALMINPNNAEALNVRGNVLCDLNRPQEALTSYTRALAVRPEHAGAFYNRGNVLQSLGRHEESLADYERALALQPDYVDALSNRGNALLTLRRNIEAGKDFERVLKIQPDFPYAQGKLLHARMRDCDWSEYEQQMARIAAGMSADQRCTMPFEFIAASTSPADQLRCARTWSNDKYPHVSPAVWQGQRYRHDRIRIAYLSADLRDHAVGYLMAGVIERHDRARFETTALSIGPDVPSGTRARLQRAFDRFVDVYDKSDTDIALLIRELEIDIVVDLNGHTGESRTGILAQRGAPVQVNFLGYAGTMGADYLDYIITDREVMPERLLPFFAEKVVRLPESFFPTDDQCAAASAPPNRAACGLPENDFVFCSFNNSYKFTPGIFDVWMGLLRDVPHSVLWLSDPGAIARENLRSEAQKRGVPAERLIFAPRTAERADHLARQQLADLFLDTLPYNAHTTACDALWGGLLVLTCPGETFAGRVAASLLQASGMTELIVRSLDDYRAMALNLARDRSKLSALKTKLAQSRGICPLFDTARYTRHLEAAFTMMWKRHESGEPPENFDVEPIEGKARD